MAFVHNMLAGARRLLSTEELDVLFAETGIASALFDQTAARVTREQFVHLYGAISIKTGDEMLGLWSRPIRAGTLKYLGLSMLDAPSLVVAMYRFTRFWNLLLDDYQLDFVRQNQIVTVTLKPQRPGETPTIFGHELMVKLSHGLASWLVGRNLPVDHVGFGFARPEHFAEYANLFPGPVAFDQPYTFVSFAERHLRQGFHKTRAELLRFVRSAPDDWIFVTFDHDAVSSRVRAYLDPGKCKDSSMQAAAAAMYMSGRTLSRKLAIEGSTFQAIKDQMRRDEAIQRLVKTQESIRAIAAQVGFDNLPAFHRAFLAWTGNTPGAYRRLRGPPA